MARWAGAAAVTPATPERAIVYTMLPRAIRLLLGFVAGAAAGQGAPPPVAQSLAVAQWATCGMLVRARGLQGRVPAGSATCSAGRPNRLPVALRPRTIPARCRECPLARAPAPACSPTRPSCARS